MLMQQVLSMGKVVIDVKDLLCHRRERELRYRYVLFLYLSLN